MTRKTLGKYEIIERIGRGGMAEVYRAYHAALDRYVAIKLLHPFLADDPEFKDRFEKEAKNVARLRHPNIVQVFDFDFDEDGESYYMVMELINGPTLKDRLFEQASNDQRYPLSEATRIVGDTASALAYAHKRQMIHRDVKPANLMLDEDGRVVLTDFGIAKIVTGGQFTASGGMVGTPAYMAPEQGLGEAGDERSDIYSLGVIFYQMVTGRLPYDADTPLAIILKHVNEPLPNPREIDPSVADWVVDIIMHALEKEPDDRYQTADELLQDLKRRQGPATAQSRSLLSQVSSSEATQGSSEQQPVRPVVINRDRKSVTQTQPLPIVTKDTQDQDTKRSPSTPAKKDQPEPPTEETQQKKSRAGMLAFVALLLIVVVIGAGLVVAGQNDQGPLATLFEEDDSQATEVAVAGEETATSTTTLTTTPTATATSSATLTMTATASNTVTATASLTASTTPTPSVTASPSPTPTATTTSSPTLSPTVTDTPTITATPSNTPNLAATDRAIQRITLTAAAIATAQAASPTPTELEILENCDLDYAIIEPLDLSEAPPLTDHPRLQRVDRSFEFQIIIENASTCDWPLGGDLQLTFVESTVEMGIDYESLTTECSTTVTTDVNFSSPRRPRFFFLELEDDIRRGETVELTFTAQAPRTRGCYLGAWQLEFAEYAMPIGEPIIVAIQVFGG